MPPIAAKSIGVAISDSVRSGISGMAGGEDQRQHAAEAVPEHVEFVDAARAHRRGTRERDVLVAVRLEAVVGVGRIRRAPVDHVDVEAATDQRLDEAVAGSQVEHVRLRHEAHHEQDRWPERGTRAVIAVELDLVAPPDDVLGRAPDFWPPDTGEVLQAVAGAERVALDVKPNPLEQIGRRWHRGHLRLPSSRVEAFGACRASALGGGPCGFVARRERRQVFGVLAVGEEVAEVADLPLESGDVLEQTVDVASRRQVEQVERPP